jgi:hypothetical protein
MESFNSINNVKWNIQKKDHFMSNDWIIKLNFLNPINIVLNDYTCSNSFDTIDI